MDNLGTRAIEAGGKLTVKSALNPTLWFCAVVSVPFLIIFTIILLSNRTIPQWILFGLFILISAPIICAIFSALFLLFCDRDKLQSEDYQIRKRSLELIEQKGGSSPILAETIESISKPTSRKILNAQRNKNSKT
jgi:hypothetical protein